jgi:5-methylcytosine-specific restriction endonuclease McrA
MLGLNLLVGGVMESQIMRLNMAGQPIEWLNWREVVCLYARDLVAWSLGGEVKRVRGGFSRLNRKTTLISLPAIVACDGERLAPMKSKPPLNRLALFQRDNFQCMYCGRCLPSMELTRDHVLPISRGGLDRWENVVTCCKRCNQKKAAWLLTEIEMPLLALPYQPNPYEYMALINSHRIRADQMAYLAPQFHRYLLPQDQPSSPCPLAFA